MALRPPKPESTDFLRVDMLRFVASAGIVWHHSHEFFYPAAMRATVTGQTRALALFVDMFFAISGFILATIYAGRVRDFAAFGRFMQRRIGRLGPLHWLTLAVMWAFWKAISLTGHHAGHIPDLSAQCMVQAAALLHAVVPCGNGMVPNGVTWSISVEMALYLAFPVFALLLPRKGVVPFLMVAAMAFALQGIARLHVTWEEGPQLARGLPSFLFGMVLSAHRAALGRLNIGNGPVVAMLALTIVLMVFGVSQLAVLASTYVTVTCAIAADSRTTADGIIARIAPLGQLTYSIYMWHSLFITVMLNAIADKYLHLSLAPMIAVAVVCYVLIMVWSYASWAYFETPARKFIDSLGAKRGKPITIVAR